MAISFEEAQELILQSEELVSPAEIEKIYDEMAKQITYDLELVDLLVLVVLNGALIPAGKLIPRLNFPVQIGYLHATRYTGETVGSNSLKWLCEPSVEVKNRIILVVEDIFDEGKTLEAIVKDLEERGAEKVYTAALINKDHERKPKDFTVDYLGLTIPDRYIFGCGMDYQEYWRNLPGIWALKETS